MIDINKTWIFSSDDTDLTYLNGSEVNILKVRSIPDKTLINEVLHKYVLDVTHNGKYIEVMGDELTEKIDCQYEYTIKYIDADWGKPRYITVENDKELSKAELEVIALTDLEIEKENIEWIKSYEEIEKEIKRRKRDTIIDENPYEDMAKELEELRGGDSDTVDSTEEFKSYDKHRQNKLHKNR